MGVHDAFKLHDIKVVNVILPTILVCGYSIILTAAPRVSVGRNKICKGCRLIQHTLLISSDSNPIRQ